MIRGGQCPPRVLMGIPSDGVRLYLEHTHFVAQLGDFLAHAAHRDFCLRHRLIILLRGGADGFHVHGHFIAGLCLLGAGLGDGAGLRRHALHALVDHVDQFDGFIRTGGAGIGLAVVAGIIRAHGGSASAVASQRGEFVITLPVLRDGPGAAPAWEGRA